jgi:glutathione reductase (NADPH)
VVEERDLGGTCPNRGCVAKKVLVAAAHSLHEIAQAKVHCIKVGEPRLDWTALIDREKQLIRPIPESIARALAERGIEVIREHATFVGPNTVRIGPATVEARHIVIATGSKPRRLPIEGAELMITSDEVLSERRLPRDAVFLGGGVVALEFSHVYARAGAKVTILEALPRLLQQQDPDAVDKIRRESERIGITLHTGVKVERIEKAGDRLRVIYQDGGQAGGTERVVEADRVVNGAGRIPNVDSLDLDAARSSMTACASWSTTICAQGPTPPYTWPATRSPRRNCLRSRATKAGSSAATSSKGRNTSRTTPPFPHASTRCRRLPPSE